MILQRLVERFESEGGTLSGYQRKAIDFVFVLDGQGQLIGIDDTRSGAGKVKRGREFDVPREVTRTAQVAANLLWDNVEYVFGIVPAGKKASAKRNQQQRTTARRNAFLDRMTAELKSVSSDAGVAAVRSFLTGPNALSWRAHSFGPDVEDGTGYLSFRLDGDTCLVCERPAVRQTVLANAGASSGACYPCLVTGQLESVARLHGAIKGVYGAQSSGARIVSFNLAAFNSFGREQGLNAPVGTSAEFAYLTVLNRLLARESRQKLRVGDSTVVFWSEKPTKVETWFADLFGIADGAEEATTPEDTQSIPALYAAPWTGVFQEESELRFFVLGLSPNAARLSIRFWHDGTVRQILDRVGQHFRDIEIASGQASGQPRALRRMLRCLAVAGKDDNLPPNLAGQIMNAILGGTPYPWTLLEAALIRCRAERSISPERAAWIKAVLVRQTRLRGGAGQEVGVSLDTSNPNVGYRLGRLFAVLERIQWHAQSKKSNIRERFYGAASAHPVVVFPQLMKLKNHHLAKIENRGQVVNLEKEIGEILEAIDHFPSHLTLEDQGRFAVGYYHERTESFAHTVVNDEA